MLNEEQKTAVDTIEGPVVVIAGPGTGKTQILTLRIANIIKKLGADMAESILALTFTESGVFAMRKRLAEFIGTELAYKVNISTFHSFSDNIIKTNLDFFPELAFSKVISEIDKIQIIEEILQNNQWEYLKTFSSDFHYTRDIISAIDELKSEGFTVEKFEKEIPKYKDLILADENSYYKRKTGKYLAGDLKPTVEKDIEKTIGKNKELAKIYEIYQKKISEKKFYDFSDMILSVIEKAKTNKDFLQILQEKYLYLLVDEHQDTNDAQNELVELLLNSEINEGRPNIFTVGDEKQAIYRFQGASLENFLNFSKKYKDVKIINLKNNYRSGQKILDISESLIETSDKENILLSKNPKFKKEQGEILLHEFTDYKEELIFIAEDIKNKIENNVDVNEIAIFYKENKGLFEIRNILEKYNIPFKVNSKENILENIAIKKLIMSLQLIDNPYNDELLAKVMFVDFFKIDTLSVLRILENFNYRIPGQKNKKMLFSLISNKDSLKKIGLEDEVIEKVLNFSSFILKQKKLSQDIDFLEFFEQFINKSGFLKMILSEDDNASALSRLEKIFDEAKKQYFAKNSSKEMYQLKDFLSYIEILQRYGISISLGESPLKDGVSLMTAHGSKGLEFEEIYITNFVDDLWGGKRKRGKKFKLPTKKVTSGDINDERRLFYVALTRAKKKVNITYSKFNIEGREKMLSRFIDEVKFSLVKNIKYDNLKFEEKINLFFKEKNINNKNTINILDKKYIKKLFLQNTLSVSALNNYFSSPIKYFFRNLIRIPSLQTKPLYLGNAIHDTLDIFFKKMKKNKKVLSFEELEDIFYEVIDKSFILKKYYEDIKKEGLKILEEYYNKYSDNFDFSAETEKKMYAEMILDNGEVLKLYGIVDKMEKVNDGKIRVVDYKTGKSWSEKNKDQKNDLRRQLVFYKLLIDKYYDDNRVDEAMLDFVQKNKKNQFERYSENISIKDVQELKKEIEDFANDIISGEFLEREYEKNKNNEEYFDLWQIINNKK